jgi:hypothetical protein
MGVLIYSYIAVVCREPPLLADKAQLFKLRHKCTETYVKKAKKREKFVRFFRFAH